MKHKIYTIFVTSALALLTACGKAPADAPAETAAAEEQASLPVIEVRSSDLHDGVWDSIITNTKNGSNVSPELSWDKVDGASGYVVYMVDTTAGNWLHWRSDVVTGTELSQGYAGKREYVGPYPPSGTHTYEIYVYALGGTPEKIPGYFDSQNANFDDFDDKLDEQASLLAYGHISGTYTKGD
ncbi:MAG: hypothetical protein ILP19_04490 [Oscillospiraceae bacterium]|nr:hypothetical protein [Oscillospiraceae bacterium]